MDDALGDSGARLVNPHNFCMSRRWSVKDGVLYAVLPRKHFTLLIYSFPPKLGTIFIAARLAH
jgi:hypothetical protein